MIYRQTFLAPADAGVEFGHPPEERERQCQGQLGDGGGVGAGAVWSSAASERERAYEGKKAVERITGTIDATGEDVRRGSWRNVIGERGTTKRIFDEGLGGTTPSSDFEDGSEEPRQEPLRGATPSGNKEKIRRGTASNPQTLCEYSQEVPGSLRK
ncbi:hypothetical protein EHS25_003776 [Saitozyma podzolica]|jgi:hypothetical protein|uniref:Uncharacterized protein n=1 Tax=Saitozyma podzolica TaxID=1890683 RepID=A0A427Y3H4_9TREE|nr:hypothetical protein EHS25_003776 [Saitozyma podzolica]